MKNIFSKFNFLKSLNSSRSKEFDKMLENPNDSNRNFTDEEKDMLKNVIGFGSSRVEDCMVPRADIIGVEKL